MTNFQVGMLLAFYPIAFLFTAPLIGDKLDYLGRKNSLFAGTIIMTVATFIFGIAGYCTQI